MMFLTHLPWWLWLIIIFFLWQFLALLFYGNGNSNEESFWEIREHNAAINKQWKKDGEPIVNTTIGWRPDPWNKNDGYRDNGDGSYSKLIRGGTKEYRERFARNVKESK